MLMLQNNFFNFKIHFRTQIIFLLSLFSAQIATANELFRFNREVVGFVDYKTKDDMLFISQNGQADWMTISTQATESVSYHITNSNCIPSSQNPMSMEGTTDSPHAGMTFAYPFLVGLGWVCVIDDKNNSIDFVSEFSLPENFYSIVYAGEDQNSSYFLMNSKPTKGTGYLHLVSINKKTFAVTTKVFATNVPGYSGAMLYDSGDVWVSTWPAKIYKISRQNLMNTTQSGAQANFTQIAQLELNNGMEMSFFMLRNNNALLYFNEDYGSYTINFSSKKMFNVSLPCLPVSGYGQEWLVLCNSISLQNWRSVEQD